MNFRKLSTYRLLVPTLLLVCVMSTPVNAQALRTSPTSILKQAEEAFQLVDYARVREFAQQGLLLGGATSTETLRLCVLAGMSEALLGDATRSKSYFIKALAIQPALDLERDISPKMREPYLEALGYWGNQKERISVKGKTDSRGRSILIQVVDPAQLAHRVYLHLRVGQKTSFARRELIPSARGRYELEREARSHGFAYYVELVDVDGNRLSEHGNEDDPFTHAAERLTPSVASSSHSGRTQSPRQRQLVVPLVLFGAGVAASASGIYFHTRRERAARQWNGSECEQPGQTRVQQCTDVQDDRILAERLAILSYSLAGALVGSGAAMLLFAQSPDEPAVTAGRLPRCGVDVLATTLFCHGSF